jgi:hypothetical protein
MRRIWTIAVALVALLLIAAQPAVAAPPIHQPGEYLQFDGWGSIVDDRTEVNVSVSIHNSRGVLQLHVTRVVYALHDGDARLVSEEYGTAYPDPALLTIDDLSVVTLAPTPVEFFDCDAHGCRSTGVDHVSATLTGSGPISTTVERGAYRSEEGCIYRYVNTYETRDALASLVFGDSTFAGEGALQHDIYNTYVTGCNPV